MFNKPLSEVEYIDIEQFCRTFGEGVRVEYKSQMIDNIPKTISSFANTLGGIILIGVETDKINNKVISITGIDKEPGIEEKIINSSLSGIYPAVIPDVKIVEIPEGKGKILPIIKVHESIEAPHAIQNSTRIYIRTGSVSQPYELAEIDRIEYLLQRRSKQQKLKEELKQDARSRIERFLGALRTSNPYIEISISPPFPYQPLITLDNLYNFCENVQSDSPIYYYVNNPQRIVNGICKFHGDQNEFSYREINHYGLIFTRATIRKSASQWRSVTVQQNNEKLFIRFTPIILNIAKTLKLAEVFYRTCDYVGTLEVEVRLHSIAIESLLYTDNGMDDLQEYKTLDNTTYSSELILVESLSVTLANIIVSLSKNILWVFNMPSQLNLTQRVEEILRANRLI